MVKVGVNLLSGRQVVVLLHPPRVAVQLLSGGVSGIVLNTSDASRVVGLSRGQVALHGCH